MLRLLPASATVDRRGAARRRGRPRDDARASCARCAGAGASIVFQGALHSLNPVQRVGQQIAEPILLHDAGGDEAPRQRGSASCSSRSACPRGRARSYPHQLSGGQRQRVMIAMALACRPAAAHRRRADDRARRDGAGPGARPADRRWSASSGVGVLFISHDLSVLGTTCDRLAVMYAGRIVEEGPARRGLRPRRCTRTRARWPRRSRRSATRRRGYAPAGLPGDPPDPARPAAGLPVPPALPGGDRRAARRRPSRAARAAAACRPASAACIRVERHA